MSMLPTPEQLRTRALLLAKYPQLADATVDDNVGQGVLPTAADVEAILSNQDPAAESARMETGIAGLLAAEGGQPMPAAVGGPEEMPVGMQSMAVPAAQAVPAAPVSAEMSGIESLTKLMSGSRGDFIRGLDTWEKIGLISKHLQNFGREDAADPVQAMRTEKLEALKGRMAVDKLRADAAERQRQATAMQAFASTLPPEKQRLFSGLGAEGQRAMLKENMTPQPFQVLTIDGETFMAFRDKSIVKLDLPRGRDIVQVDDGAEIQFVDRNTNEVLKTVPRKMSPYQVGTLAVAQGGLAVKQQNANKPRDGGFSQTSMKNVKLPGGKTGQREVYWDKATGHWRGRAGNAYSLAESTSAETPAEKILREGRR